MGPFEVSERDKPAWMRLDLCLDLRRDTHPGALQGVRYWLELLERCLVERNAGLSAGLLEHDLANSILVRARHVHRQKLDVEAPDRTPEHLKHAAVERDDAVLIDFNFEQIHQVEGTKPCPFRVGAQTGCRGHVAAELDPKWPTGRASAKVAIG